MYNNIKNQSKTWSNITLAIYFCIWWQQVRCTVFARDEAKQMRKHFCDILHFTDSPNYYWAVWYPTAKDSNTATYFELYSYVHLYFTWNQDENMAFQVKFVSAVYVYLSRFLHINTIGHMV